MIDLDNSICGVLLAFFFLERAEGSAGIGMVEVQQKGVVLPCLSSPKRTAGLGTWVSQVPLGWCFGLVIGGFEGFL